MMWLMGDTIARGEKLAKLLSHSLRIHHTHAKRESAAQFSHEHQYPSNQNNRKRGTTRTNTTPIRISTRHMMTQGDEQFLLLSRNHYHHQSVTVGILSTTQHSTNTTVLVSFFSQHWKTKSTRLTCQRSRCLLLSHPD